MNSTDDFATRLTLLRSNRGLSQADLGKLTKIASAQLSRYETGLNTPRTKTIATLAKFFEVSTIWLATGKNQTSGQNSGLDSTDPLQASEFSHNSIPEMEAEMTKLMHQLINVADKLGLAISISTCKKEHSKMLLNKNTTVLGAS